MTQAYKDDNDDDEDDSDENDGDEDDSDENDDDEDDHLLVCSAWVGHVAQTHHLPE